MCGICGFTGPPNAQALSHMIQTLQHRGPDDQGRYQAEGIHLGMRRLSIVDPETGQQPVHNEEQTIWCVFNGEIYNAPELKQKLTDKGHHFYTHHADSEVIVHAYEEYGLDFCHHLNGMFAIALWDLTQNRLILIRDRLGVKPLFYQHYQNNLFFASEIKAILAHPDIPRHPNWAALYHYFSFKNIPAPDTAFQNIYAVKPGEMLIFSEGVLQTHTWWQLNFSHETELSRSEACQQLLSLLEDATRLRMRADVPFGAYLSGGVDSSAIVALMSGLQNKRIQTFSLGYHDSFAHKQADLLAARKVASLFGTDHHEYLMSSQELERDLPAVIRAFDQPFSGTISTFFLSKMMTQQVHVALSGDGADEIFGSYLTHRTAQAMAYYRHLQARPRAQWSAQDYQQLEPCSPEFLAQLYTQSAGDEVRWKYHLLLATDTQKQTWLSPLFTQHLHNHPNTLARLQQTYQHLSARTPLNRVLELELKTQFPDQVLAFVDHLSMAHALEVRSPFMDYRLVEFAATLPDQWKIKGPHFKVLLKEALTELLPAEILERPKEGFVLPVYHWMKGALKTFIMKTLAPAALQKHQMLNTAVIQNLLNSYYHGQDQYAGKIWNLAMFQLWWELYFE
jgi:asparagine synthase (glutamine-hydrolysing)